MPETHVVILAAGNGTRMKSGDPKVLHHAGGLQLIEHVLRAADTLEPATTVVVVGHLAERVEQAGIGDDDRVVYPFFFSDARGRFSPLVEVESAILDRHHRLRVYLPPGYEENTLARYPFAYMQDGQNLFFPHEAFQHKDWGVKETSQILRSMQ